MNWFYNYGGESHAITLRPYVPIIGGVYDGKFVAVCHDGQPLYTPLTAPNSEVASDIPINFGGQTFAAGKNPDVIFDERRPNVATACTVIADHADFSTVVDDKPLYTNLNRIHATRENSSLKGNINANYFYLVGGNENFIVGGIGADRPVLHNSSALIVDFGVGLANKRASGMALATSVAEKGYTVDETTGEHITNNTVPYNAFDTGSYNCGSDNLHIFGTVTGIYADTSAGKSTAVLDVAVTYSDEGGSDRVVLLKNISKAVKKYGTNPTYYENYQTINQIIIREYSSESSYTTLSQTAKQAMFAEWDAFPTDLRPILIRLYEMFNQSGYYSTFGDTEAVHQSLPAWLGGESD